MNAMPLQIRRRMGEAGLAIVATGVSFVAGARRNLNFTLRYPTAADDAQVPPVVAALAPRTASPKWTGAVRSRIGLLFHPALAFWSRMICSENRFPLFGIMR
jgi:hypothetical protein